MKTSGLLALSLALCATTQADFVIDDFDTGANFNNGLTGAAGASSITGNRVTTITDDAFGVAVASTGGAGDFAFDIVNPTNPAAGQLGGHTQIAWSISPYDLHSSGNFPGAPLVLDFSEVTGSFDLVVSYGSSATAGPSPQSFATISVDAAGKYGFNGGDLGDGLLASNVETINFLFTATSTVTSGADQVAGFKLDRVAAVPEPATIALLGMTGVFGFVAYRRRRKTETAS